MAIPSLSYEPATEREMYPGTIEIIAAATNPAPVLYSRVKQSGLINDDVGMRAPAETYMYLFRQQVRDHCGQR